MRTALARLTPDGQLDAPKVTQYVWDQSYIDTPILRYQDANGDGDTADAGETLYYTTDANHNITGLVGQVLNEQTQSLEWKVVERYVYDAYGKVKILNGNADSGIQDWSPKVIDGTTTPVSASPLGNEILYCGYRYDSETAITTSTLTGVFGSYQVRNREYNVLLSQWTTQDPMGYAAGDANLRRYCGNRAVTATDPMGEEIYSDTCLDGYFKKKDVKFKRTDIWEGLYVSYQYSSDVQSMQRVEAHQADAGQEILRAMLRSERTFKIRKSSREKDGLANLEDHVNARIKIIEAAKNKTFGFDLKVAWPEMEIVEGAWHPKSGSLSETLENLFKEERPDVQMGCVMGATVTMLRGIAVAMNDNGSFDAISKEKPDARLMSGFPVGGHLRVELNVPTEDWIPGDMGVFHWSRFLEIKSELDTIKSLQIKYMSELIAQVNKPLQFWTPNETKRAQTIKANADAARAKWLPIYNRIVKSGHSGQNVIYIGGGDF